MNEQEKKNEMTALEAFHLVRNIAVTSADEGEGALILITDGKNVAGSCVGQGKVMCDMLYKLSKSCAEFRKCLIVVATYLTTEENSKNNGNNE